MLSDDFKVNEDLLIDYTKFPAFPVVNGECGSNFKVEDVFGYFIHSLERSATCSSVKITRVEGMNQIKDAIKALEDDPLYGHDIVRITRRFFWDDEGQVREWDVYVPTDSLDIRAGITKTVECDRTRIFAFDMTYLYSLNAEFFANRYGGKVLSNQAKKQKSDMSDSSFQSELDGWMAEVYKHTDPALSFELVSEYSDQFNRRDASNMIKIPEDAICGDILNINDARNYFISNRKLYSHDGNERLYLKVTLINYWM